jgi:hypothetical protein
MPNESTTFDVRMIASSYGTFTGTVSFGNNDFDENPFDFTVRGRVSQPQVTIIDDGDRGYYPGGFLPGPKREGYSGDVDYSPAHATRRARWEFLDLEAGTYRVAATSSPAYNRATNAPYHIDNGPAIRLNQRRHPRDFMANGARWEVLDDVQVMTDGGSIIVSLKANGINGIAIADAIRLVKYVPRLLDEVGEFAVIDNGEPGFSGDSQGVSTWATVGRTSYDGEYGYLKDDSTGNAARWTFNVVPGTYQVSMAWQHAPYNRATDAPVTITAGATTLYSVDVNQTLPPSADQFGKGVAYANGVAFQVLTSVTVPEGVSFLEVRTTDRANSYVILDAVMVRMVSEPSITVSATGAEDAIADEPQTPSIALGASDLMAVGGEVKAADASAGLSAAGANPAQVDEIHSARVATADLPGATSASQALAAPAEKRARDDVLARVDSWLQLDLNDLLDRRFDDDSDEEDEDDNLWWLLYGQE